MPEKVENDSSRRRMDEVGVEYELTQVEPSGEIWEGWAFFEKPES